MGIEKPIRNVAFDLTRKCPLRCEYCYNENNEAFADTTIETAMRVIDWLRLPTITGEVETVSLIFFGGEPLSKFEILKETVEYVEKTQTKEKQIICGLTTNCVLLSREIIDFFKKYKIRPYLSIDGPEMVHDRHRRKIDGTGSFRDIEPFIREMVESKMATAARPTVTPQTVEDMFTSMKYLVDDLGFFNISPTPITEPTTNGFAWDMASMDKLRDQYNLIKNWMVERVEKRLPNAICDTKIINCIRQNTGKWTMKRPCAAGMSYLGVSTNGDIFPCPRFASYPQYKIGTIWEDTINEENTKFYYEFNCRTLNDRCKNCHYGYCGGGCYASKLDLGDDLSVEIPIHCEHTKMLNDVSNDLIVHFKGDSFFKSLIKNDDALRGSRPARKMEADEIQRYAKEVDDFNARALINARGELECSQILH